MCNINCNLFKLLSNVLFTWDKKYIDVVDMYPNSTYTD